MLVHQQRLAAAAVSAVAEQHTAGPAGECLLPVKSINISLLTTIKHMYSDWHHRVINRAAGSTL